MKYAIDIEHLMVNYEKNCVLFDLCLKVPVGKMVAILGPNGAGKTSFIKSILEFITPISGKVHILGKPFKEQKGKISYIPQIESIDWSFPMTVFDFVLMGAYGRIGLFKRPSSKDKQDVARIISEVGMEGYEKRQINELSGGQKQRLFIARALMQESEVYFMDEPFSGVDLHSQEVIASLLHTLRDKGKTLFVVHHGLEQVKDLFDWVIFINRSLVAHGPVESTFTQEMVARAFGSHSSLLDEGCHLLHHRSQGNK